MRTVRDITFDLLRKLELTTIIGNPGSTEEPFLKNFPKDFSYILALHEASVVAIADGLAQGLRKPMLVNIHTGAGLGNAMACIMTAYQNKTPLIITAGQQTREMLLIEPFLTNIEAINMPKPWVKWSYEPARAQDVPGAFMRAYAMAAQPPQGPVFLSLPLDDWDKKIPERDMYRTITKRTGPDPQRLEEFSHRINASQAPVLVLGADIARHNAWEAGVRLAEKLNCPVWSPPFSERTAFPEEHVLYQGVLAPAIAPLAKQLQGHDVVLVIGAPVFRYYPFVTGSYLPKHSHLLQITDDPDATAKAAIGDSLVSDTLLCLEALLPLVKPRTHRKRLSNKKALPTPAEEWPLSAAQIFARIHAACPDKFIVVAESPSNVGALQQEFKMSDPNSFYTFASGALGWGMPAAVGLAIAEKQMGHHRPVLAFIGDGSFQYSLQSIYTSVQQNLHVIFIVLRNYEYAILKQFAQLEKTPNVPGLDLPGIDVGTLGKGYGAEAFYVKTPAEITWAISKALQLPATSVIEIPTSSKLQPLLG